MTEKIPTSIVLTVHLSPDEALALLGWLAGIDIVHLEDTGAVAPRLTFAAVIGVMGALQSLMPNCLLSGHHFSASAFCNAPKATGFCRGFTPEERADAAPKFTHH